MPRGEAHNEVEAIGEKAPIHEIRLGWSCLEDVGGHRDRVGGLVGNRGLSLSSATVEQERLLRSSPRRPAAGSSSAEALSGLDSVHQDMQMLVDLVERSRHDRELEPATERRVWESAFRALAVVVVPYRIMALVEGRDSRGPGDRPTENRATPERSWRIRRNWGRPPPQKWPKPGQARSLRDRSFLVYATPVGGRGRDRRGQRRGAVAPRPSPGRNFPSPDCSSPIPPAWSGRGVRPPPAVAIADPKIVPKLRRPGDQSGLSDSTRTRPHALGSFPRPPSASPRRWPGRPETGSVTWIASTQPMLEARTVSSI